MSGKGYAMMRYLSWFEFDRAMADLGAYAIEKNARTVFGIPRGGLVVAVAVSHQIGLPLVDKYTINRHTLIVDDIADTGRTMAAYREYPLRAVWYMRWNCATAVWAARVETTEAWLVFPWENHKAAEADFKAYREKTNAQA